MAHVIVVGAGAIGSHLVPLLARSSRVARLTIVDRDSYESSNVAGQDIDRIHVGGPKALIQARKVRRINSHITAKGIHGSVEDLPLAALRADVILSCLDSRAARMIVNQAAYRLGVTWIDAGIEAAGLLARVRVFTPDHGACLECTMDQADYDVLEQAYPCAPAIQLPTRAPSSLGALAASFQTIECEKVLAREPSLDGRELLIDARFHKHYVTECRRNPACRMPDHEPWQIESVASPSTRDTLEEVMTMGSTFRGAEEWLSFSVAGQRVVTEVRCSSCATSQAVFQLERHVRKVCGRCPACGGPLSTSGFHIYDAVQHRDLSANALRCTLSAIGLRPHDVITLHTPQSTAHFEIGSGS